MITLNIFILLAFYFLLTFIFFINSYKKINEDNIKKFIKNNFISLLFCYIFIIFSINFCSLNSSFNKNALILFRILGMIQAIRIVYSDKKLNSFLLLLFAFFINKPYVFLSVLEVAKGCGSVKVSEMLGYSNFISIPIIVAIIVIELLLFVYNVFKRLNSRNIKR